MIACLDVHYTESMAYAAALVFEDWTSPGGIAEHYASLPHSANYEPGRFDLRELEPLLAVIRLLDRPIHVFVIDGYCQLSAEGEPGLGVHLAKALDGSAAIVGVAKNRYRTSTHAVELQRGKGSRPLFITAIGMEAAQAAQHIASMAGEFRLPTLLRAVDRLSSLHAANEEVRRLLPELLATSSADAGAAASPSACELTPRGAAPADASPRAEA